MKNRIHKHHHRRYLCLRQRLILLHHHRQNADFDTPQSGSQETVEYHDPEGETEEHVLNEEEIEHLQSQDSESTKNYESEFVQFDGDDFVLLGHKSAAPHFKSYDVKGFQKVLSQERKENTQIGSSDYASDFTAVR